MPLGINPYDQASLEKRNFSTSNIINIISPEIVTNGLTLYLDAGNTRSYPGSGTFWYDLSGNNYDFTINASAYSTANGIPHMNFEGTYYAAKRLVGGLRSDVPNFLNATVMTFSTILNSTTDYRTLIRGTSEDHQILINTGQTLLGMYNNDAQQGFYSSGFNITSLPNPYTQFNCLTFKLSQSSPYYQFQYNNNTTIYSSTNVNTTFNRGFSSLGAHHNNSDSMTVFTQYWGKISIFLYYNRHLNYSEIEQNFNVLRTRFGI